MNGTTAGDGALAAQHNEEPRPSSAIESVGPDITASPLVCAEELRN